MTKEKIRITLQSFNHKILNECCKKILDLLNTQDFITHISGPISFPTRKRFYCVLRSPHVNKDSREQFEIRRYKKILDIYSTSQKTINILLKLEIPAGISINLLN
ncbi:unnamed protein product [Discosporangium mesarthrocarpum]